MHAGPLQAPAWRERAPSPAPGGLVAAGPAARVLLNALAGREAEALQGLRIVPTQALLVLLGDAEQLPWIDGVRYCAPNTAIPGLWLPTWLAPDLPPDLLHAALRRRTGHASMLLWPAPALVLGLDDALPLQPAILAWLDKEFS